MKKFVFIDIDGTLYDHNNHIVPSSAIEALRRAKDNGHELFICTGRPKPVVESSYLKLPISGAVFAGGTHIEV
ncbi:MAG: HAD family phosphatase, partial [Erysipelotrichaceae bacterium]|nr:HAD family phosphatase [Erysipelotrichaceae bacterium]